MPIHIKKYYPAAKPLKHLIKYFWVLDSAGPISLNHQILPMGNIDLLINLASPMTFEKKGIAFGSPGSICFSGLSHHHTVMKQQGIVFTIGVSFFPTGFYPFFKIPVSTFKNRTVSLDAILNKTARQLEEKLRQASRLSEKIKRLEVFFIDRLDPGSQVPEKACILLNHFYTAGMRVHDFCNAYGVQTRTFERLFNTYVGTTPKQFFRLNRFQGLLNRMLQLPREVSLTDLAMEFDYYDQAHFIHDFKAFTGNSPSVFLTEKRSLIQNMKIL